MKKTPFYTAKPTLYLTLIFLVLGIQHAASQTYCSQAGSEGVAGEKDGYRYELWNQNGKGTACITLGSGALFSGEWSDIENYLARRGLGYDQTQEHQEIGTFYATYDCIYNPSTASGNSYLSVYGWTVDPLKEFYIVEDWRTWIPSMAEGASLTDSFYVNGSYYDIYENTRVNQPSIAGNATFKQYFSIRREVRDSGTVNISEHFNKWESLGMDLGKMYEVSFVVEGYHNSGSFEFTDLDVYVDNEPARVPEEPAEPSRVSIYPNPGSESLSVTIDEPDPDASIKIYDTSGMVIFSRENIYNNLLQISHPKNGIYFVNVNSNTFNYNAKLLVY
jgi:endo-1,4-beta-xylanase